MTYIPVYLANRGKIAPHHPRSTNQGLREPNLDASRIRTVECSMTHFFCFESGLGCDVHIEVLSTNQIIGRKEKEI